MDECTVRDGLFVEPCEALDAVIDNRIPGFSKARGIFKQDLTNIKTGQPARSYIGVKSKEKKNGFLFNFCPFCGSQIDAPFNDDSEGQADG